MREGTKAAKTPPMKKPEWLVILVALIAAAAKLYCACTTSGTLDVVCFREFGRIISDEGLIALYRKVPIFNHTPLVGTLAGALFDATEGRDGPFRFFLRLPGILADFGSVLALLWLRRRTGRPDWWALALFAASPVAFMVSGFHGNIDSVLAFGLLLTALTCFSGEAALCGLCWGLTCQVKIIPLLVAPIFFFYWWQRGKARKFFTVAVITVLIGWAWPLFTIPGVFLRRVLDYNSMWGTWGISALLNFSGLPGVGGVMGVERMSHAGAWISEVMKLGVMAGVCTLAWRRRAGEAPALFTTLSLCWLVFFTFAPGFGAPYLIWLTPFVVVCSGRWYAALTAASSVALFAFYTVVCGSLPWDKAYEAIRTAPRWIPWLLPAWVTMAACLFAMRRDWRLPACTDAPHQPEPEDRPGLVARTAVG
jgi:hypothetical protein